MGEYWCESFFTNRSRIQSEKITAYSTKNGNEFALRIVLEEVCKLFESCKIATIEEKAIDWIQDKLEDLDAEVRLMKIYHYKEQEDSLDALFHISTGKHLDIDLAYSEGLRILENLEFLTLIYFRSSEFCMAETINDLDWPLAKINSVTISKKLCLVDDRTPVTRTCAGNFVEGAIWMNVSQHCIENPTISNITTQLRNMLEASTPEIEDRWDEIIKDDNLTVLDIYYLSRLLDKIHLDDTNASWYAINLVDKLMIGNSNTLVEAQKLLDSPDTILGLIEEIFTKSYIDLAEVSIIYRKNLIVHVSNPFLTNVSGLLLYGNQSLVDFHRHENLEDINTEDLLLATHIPEEVLQQINDTNTRIVTTIFFKNVLFVDDKYQAASFVISVIIPNFGTYLEVPVSIIFKSNAIPSHICGFWDYGMKSTHHKGEWSLLGGTNLGSFKRKFFHHCTYMHLTHFALLVMSDINVENTTEDLVFKNHVTSLQLVTVVGGILSITGIAGIVVTALLFKNWRQKTGTKILLHLSAIISLEVTFIHLSEIESLSEDPSICKVIGMILHYVVLSKFAWLLAFAVLQYHRFVKVLGQISKNIIWKCVIFCWGVPLVTVFLIGLLPSQNYVSTSYDLCYPRGLLLYLSIILPVLIIVITNITIFGTIMYNINSSKVTMNGQTKLFKAKLYLALLLFFMLGVPWIFGIIAELLEVSTLKLVLFYIFCTTGTVQGFILFVFYVVLNQETRHCWYHYLKNKVGGGS